MARSLEALARRAAGGDARAAAKLLLEVARDAEEAVGLVVAEAGLEALQGALEQTVQASPIILTVSYGGSIMPASTHVCVSTDVANETFARLALAIANDSLRELGDQGERADARRWWGLVERLEAMVKAKDYVAAKAAWVSFPNKGIQISGCLDAEFGFPDGKSV